MSRLKQLLNQSEASVHLVGCGGTGLRALGEFGRDLGWSVSGSDAVLNERIRERLEAQGMVIHQGHAAENLPGQTDLVVYSPAVPTTNVEREAAVEQLIPDASYPEMLGEISRKWPTIAVTGTHGKSTTTGLIGTALSALGLDRAVLCGAELLDRQRHGWSGPGHWAVIEACEYRRHFLELSPEISIILGIEADHFDCYPNVELAIEAYTDFVKQLKPGGLLLLNVETRAARTLLDRLKIDFRIETMSVMGGAATWMAREVQQKGNHLEFRIEYNGQPDGTLSVPILGVHHASNVLAAWVALRHLDVPPDDIRKALSGFGGLARRLEALEDWRGVRRFNDYAHHPTAVEAVLRTLRVATELWPWTGGRLICAFQPHQLARAQEFRQEFAEALSTADEAWVLPVYAARESGSHLTDQLSMQIVKRIGGGCQGRFVPTLDHALLTMETALRPGDVFVTLGAGDIDSLQYDISRRIP